MRTVSIDLTEQGCHTMHQWDTIYDMFCCICQNLLNCLSVCCLTPTQEYFAHMNRYTTIDS